MTIPLTGRHLIEASAGTGKTYTLTALYLRLILGHDPGNPARQPLLPPDILVVTFTEAATKELSDRIRTRLTEAAAVFSGFAAPRPEDAVLNALLDAYGSDAERLRYAEHLHAAADWMDEAAIYTIHGFCNRMLTQHAFHSGSPFDLTLSPDEQMIREEAIADYWREHLYELSEPALQTISAVISGNAKKPQLSLSHFRQLLNKAIGNKALLGLSPPQEAPTTALVKKTPQWQAAIEAIRKADGLEAFNHALEKAWQEGVLKQNKKPTPATWRNKTLPALQQWLEQPDVLLPEPDSVDFDSLTLTALKQALRLNQTLPTALAEHPLPMAVENFIEIRDALEATSADFYAHAAQWVDARAQATKRKKGLISYQDMLTRLLDALEQPEGGVRLAHNIREQFPVALIDEFQDTDPVQYGIFQAIYQQADAITNGLFLIGDPKQAIYSFRGADLNTYLKAAREVPTTHRHTLDCNYRSAAAMVAATNHLFHHSPAAPNQFLEPMVQFHRVASKGRDDHFEVDGQTASALTIWHADTQLTMPDYRHTMAMHCARQIDQLLSKGAAGHAGFRTQSTFMPLRAADIAILVRTGQEADIVRQALQASGHRSVYLSDRDNVLKTAEARDVLRWLQAMAEPESERQVRTAMGTASLGYDWGDLHAAFTDDAQWEALLERFWDYARLWQQRGVLPALRRFIYDQQLAPRLLRSDGGERRLSNILQLSELLQDASAKRDGPAALIHWLSEQITQSDEATPADEQILRLESDADVIKVVTIHKSKGLEYPLVFLPFICSFRKAKKQTPEWLETDRATEEQARQAEDMRLLYVATTRAIHACWLGLAPIKSLQETAIGRLIGCQADPSADDLKALLEAVAKHDAGIQLEHLPDSPMPPAKDGLQVANFQQTEIAMARHYRAPPPNAERWWIASYSALLEDGPTAWTPGNAEEDRLVEESQNSVSLESREESKDIHTLPHGPATGTLIHQLLQSLAEECFPLPNERRFERVLATRLRSRRWQDHTATLHEWLGQLTTVPLPIGPENDFSLAALQSGEFTAELEFLISVADVRVSQLDQLIRQHTMDGIGRPALGETALNGMLKGFIDLIVVHQGRYYLIDYKSNDLGPGDAHYHTDALRDAILKKRYDAQFSLYLLALHRLLRARLGNAYDYDRHMGGAVCWFLRGIHHSSRGVYAERPERRFVESLDRLFEGESSHVA